MHFIDLAPKPDSFSYLLFGKVFIKLIISLVALELLIIKPNLSSFVCIHFLTNILSNGIYSKIPWDGKLKYVLFSLEKTKWINPINGLLLIHNPINVVTG